ncbi:MAG: hypothetical protein PHN84_12580 [Desulfuromonadaceae bacterium]|nr:hypothetical protein [Desulfuromonadaceae bacterium]MDD2855804.1 hypothetical protein [Desulfuromonadaceae bacterium]
MSVDEKLLEPSLIPLRINVGVTGHRSISNEDKVRQQIFEILTGRWREALTITSVIKLDSASSLPIAFTAISPLAEGADRLVAEVVLTTAEGRLEVPLPMSGAEYKKDFSTPESKQQFDLLLLKAVRAYERHPLHETYDPQVSKYLWAGNEVVRSSDIIIAIWDGKPAKGTGGTAQIVDLAKESGKPVFVISSQSPYAIELFNAASIELGTLIDRISFYNSSNVNIEEGFSVREFEKIFASKEGTEIPDRYKNEVIQKLLPHYVKSSLLASHNQRRYQKTGKMAYVISTASVAFMAMAVVFGSTTPLVAIVCYVAELIALCGLFQMIHKAHKAHVHINWLENRALAERIRSTFFYVFCGIRPNPLNEFADVTNSNWINRVVTEIRDGLSVPEYSGSSSAPIFVNFIRTMWINDQISYHQEKTTASNNKNKMLKVLGIRLFAAAILVSAIHLISALMGAAGRHPSHLMLIVEEILTVIAVTLPAAAAAVGGYRILMEHSRIASRSASMVQKLSLLDARIRPPKTSDDLEHLIVCTEKIMLAESQDWTNLMSHADLERIA